MQFRVTTPAENTRGPQYLAAALDALHQADGRRLAIDLEVAWHGDQVALLAGGPGDLLTPLIEQLADAYPDCTWERVADDNSRPRKDKTQWSTDLRLVPDFFPIRTASDFEDRLNRRLADPLSGLLSSVRAASQHGAAAKIVISLRPATVRHMRSTLRALARLRRGFPRVWLSNRFARWITAPTATTRVAAIMLRWLFPSGSHAPNLDDAQRKLQDHLFETRIRLAIAGNNLPPQPDLDQLAGSFGRFTSTRARFELTSRRPGKWPPRRRGFLLSAAEVAALWHPPVCTVRVEKLPPSSFRELEPPLGVPVPQSEPSSAVLGRLCYRRRREDFGIRLDDRRRHVAVIGKTGMGKSTLMQRLIISDIDAGRGVCLIDPHGDLAEAVLSGIPKRRTNDVVLFDAGDRAHPIAYNPLDCRRIEDRPLVASGVLSAFKKLHADSWGPRMEHIWRNALLAVLDQPGATLETVSRLLTSFSFRRQIVERISDPVVRAFWTDEFAKWKPQFQSEAVAPIQNKLGQFLTHPIVRAILVNPRSKLRLRTVMDERRVLIVNLSKGRIGEDASTFLGALLVTELQLAAMSRANVAEPLRQDFFAYVDEFQNFATESFATILSEARKYRLSLVIANQYLAQMDDATRDAVFGNVGSVLCFQVGASDAELLAEQLGGDVVARDLLSLPKYTAYARLLIDGMPSRPFSMQTLSLQAAGDPRRIATIRRTSSHRYAAAPCPG